MPRVLDITGEYPADWKEISDRVWAEAGHRCIRCGHPYRKGEHGKGQWTPCDSLCRHGGPLAVLRDGDVEPTRLAPRTAIAAMAEFDRVGIVVAEWRVATVHHFDGNKSNCVWWNLLALCQRCHLKTQARVDPQVPYILEHSDWLKPYVAGFYAHKYEGRTITREEAVAQMDRLLAYERLA
jgi:5-methylcytosine-specific restriction endonuclease McrA